MQNKSSNTESQSGAKNDAIPKDNETRVTLLTLLFSALAAFGFLIRALKGGMGNTETILLWVSVVVFTMLFMIRLIYFVRKNKDD